MPAKGLRARQAGAWALVLATVVASTVMRMIVGVGSFSRVTIGTSTSIESATCIAVAAETLMYWDRNTLPTALRCLVDQRVPAGLLEERALAGVELVSSRQRALCLLHHRTLEQRVNLTVGPMILGCRGL